ncbi:hypothetical protein Rs2_39278 [Raphanus sativus]|nr:hypothetical protein Rs2_39278 [Raphanus sativus]
MIEDEDDTMVEDNVATNATALGTQGGGRGEPSQTDMQSDSALPLTQVPVQHPVAPAVVGVEYPLVGRRTMEAPMEFWDGLMEGDPVMVEGMAPDHAGGGMRGDGAGNEADDDASSTASCVNLVLPAVAPEKEPVAPHAKGNNDTTKVHDTGNELIDAFEKFLASGGEGTSKLVEVGETSKGPLPAPISPPTVPIVVPSPSVGLVIGCVSEPKQVEKEKASRNTTSDGSGDDEVVGACDKELYVGQNFATRDEFKQHMALYAIKNKFVYRCAKSSPSVMVLECCGRSCVWRVYAVLVKGSCMYEVRKVRGGHSCSVDERAGYQKQATSSVIGEMLRQQFSGTGIGPRPREIRQVMRGDHAVYPTAGHCACILHLKRNIRTIFKQRQLGYLLTKAARAFRMGEFYTTFNEIRSINPGCADDRSCSCMEFQKLGIPCTHAIAAALKANVKVAGLVDETYTMNYLKSAYASHILPPVELDSSYQLSAEVAALCLNPPATRRPPGRPRKKRLKRGVGGIAAGARAWDITVLLAKKQYDMSSLWMRGFAVRWEMYETMVVALGLKNTC